VAGFRMVMAIGAILGVLGAASALLLIRNPKRAVATQT